MPVDTVELINAVSLICDEREMRVTMKQSAKGAAITGATAFLGGVLGGPVGLAAGAILGGVGSAYKMQGWKPLGEILRNDLTPTQRERLQSHIMAAVRDVGPQDLALLIPIIMGDAAVQTAVLRTVTSFVTNEMGLRMID
ncbi:protein C19orf12 homolog [Culicoides brevitarsis]|uniref:protein C19orf12 homolog n=1 Tax=Culicoides brevitarsis TaxID=469753 RepID=UPI00307BE6EB